MTMKVSGVLPVHNEEAMLRFTLPFFSAYALDELVVVLDRCTDHSEELICRANLPYPVRILYLTEKTWSYPTAEPVNLGLINAWGDVIHRIDSDTIFNPAVFRIDWTGLDAVSFPYLDYPLNKPFSVRMRASWINTYRKLKDHVYPKFFHTPNLYGLYAIRKTILDIIHLEDVPIEDLWLLRQILKRGFRYRFFNIMNYHLRPPIDSYAKQSLHGAARVSLDYPLWKVIAHSVIFSKPSILKAYLREKTK